MLIPNLKSDFQKNFKKFHKIAKNRKKSQKIAKNRKKSQKTKKMIFIPCIIPIGILFRIEKKFFSNSAPSNYPEKMVLTQPMTT